LWENFYPRVRHENSTADAAEIVVRFLRQRVTIAPGYPAQPGVESMWNGHVVNAADFEVLYVAALRSVGVPARLNALRQAEFWTGEGWQAAPRPLATTWVER
jgi:transglutaminase-like putative cysteine protease